MKTRPLMDESLNNQKAQCNVVMRFRKEEKNEKLNNSGD